MLQEAVQCNMEMYHTLHKVCAPLENFFNINLIQYRRFYLTGGLICLFNHLDWMKVSYENEYWHSSVFKHKLNELMAKGTLYYLWPIAPINNDPIYNGLYNHNIWNGITIYRKYDDCVESYAFATTRENSERRNFYFSEIEILEHFILYFRSKVFPLIHSMEKKILIPHKMDLSPQLERDQIKQQFMNETDVAGFYLRLCGVDVKISKREEQCMSLLACGKRTKEIASMLSLSPRTIECHIENLKEKTHSHTTSQLILLYQKNSLHVAQSSR